MHNRHETSQLLFILTVDTYFIASAIAVIAAVTDAVADQS